VIFNESDGTYQYTVQPPPGWRPTPSGGAVQVDGNPVGVPVTFSAVTFGVEFVASGLPAGVGWSVAIAGQSISSHGLEANASLANGSYPWTLVSPAGFDAEPESGSVTVSGAAQVVPVAFAPVSFTVTFLAADLSPGAAWQVSVAGTPHAASGGEVAIALPNGSYSYVVGPPNGEAVSPASGNFTVQGKPVSLTLQFTAASNQANGSTGLSPVTLLILIAIPVIAIAAVVVLWSRSRRGRGPHQPDNASAPPPPGAGLPPD
jgi:hypothetical protein